ncbi:MAG: diguanylate cyclase [Desulfuromonas sp.]|nr:MAG: diguanylate cyclase [Desulfuromonas sp.]
MAQGKTILLVDEDASYKDLLWEALNVKYRVIEAVTCDEVLLLVAESSPDLIIIDVDISGQCGVELCQNLKEEVATSDIPILLVTTATQSRDFILGLQAGANDYITKPMCLPAVLARIESHLRSQSDYAELEQNDLLMLLEVSETISVTRSPNAILRLIVNKISNAFDVERCSVISFSNDGDLVVKASSDLDKNREINLDMSRYPEIAEAVETRQTVIINDIKNHPMMVPVREHITGLNYNSVIVIPLIKKESVIGTFFLRTASREKNWASARICKLCQLMANIAANALENATLFESIKTAQEHFEEMSIRDDLTRIYNRRHFFNRLKEEFSRSVRYAEPLSLIFFDIDKFKDVNDNYGHTAGDQILRQVGTLLTNIARKSDLPARYGGDEFVMMLPNTEADGAYELAGRVASVIQNYAFAEIDNRSITVSMGVSSCIDDQPGSFEELIKMADDAMYRSKEQGPGYISVADVETFVR